MWKILPSNSIILWGDYRIEEIAVTMVKLYGKSLKRETGRAEGIDIQVIGWHPGGKLYEELFITADHRETEVEKITATSETWLDWDELTPELVRPQSLSDTGDSVRLRHLLMKLVFSGKDIGDSAEKTSIRILNPSEQQSANIDLVCEIKGLVAAE